MTRQRKVLHLVFFTRFETFMCTYHSVFLMSPECIPMVFPHSRQFWCIKSLYSVTKIGCPKIFLSHKKLFARVFVRRVFSWAFSISDQIVHFSAILDIKHQIYTKNYSKVVRQQYWAYNLKITNSKITYLKRTGKRAIALQLRIT